jgi:hypothetical protein
MIIFISSVAIHGCSPVDTTDKRSFTFADVKLMKKCFEFIDIKEFGFLSIISSSVRSEKLRKVIKKPDDAISKTPIKFLF